MMQVMDWAKVNELAVKQVGKCAVYISNNLPYDTPMNIAESENVWKRSVNALQAEYGVDATEYIDAILIGGLCFFDSPTERDIFFSVFMQDGIESSCLFACTYAANGVCLNENT